MSRKHIPRVILARGEGQLGNRLFQFASFYAASLELGFALWNPAFGDYAADFPALAGDVFCRPGCRSPLKVSRGLACAVLGAISSRQGRFFTGWLGGKVLDIAATHDARELEYDLGAEEFSRLLLGSRFVIMRGWKFRAREALWGRREEVREVFRPRVEVCSNVERALRKAKGDADVLIGVHVRRGDYAGWLGGRYFFEWEDYARWMVQAAHLQRGRRVAFLVCSNDGSKSLPEVPGARVSAGPGGVVEDLYALAGCDLLMGPPSTFTLWASYWGGVRLHMLEEVSQTLWEGGFVMHERA